MIGTMALYAAVVIDRLKSSCESVTVKEHETAFGDFIKVIIEKENRETRIFISAVPSNYYLFDDAINDLMVRIDEFYNSYNEYYSIEVKK